MKNILFTFLLMITIIIVSNPSAAYADTIAKDVTVESSPINLSGGGNAAVVVFIRSDAGVTAVTVGGISATKNESRAAADSVGAISMWTAVLGSASGNQTISITGSFGSFEAIAYTGVDQTTPVDVHTNNHAVSATSIDTSLTPTGSNEWMVLGVDTNGGFAINSQTNVVLRSAAADPCVTLNPCREGDSNGVITGATTQTVGSSGAQNWSTVAVTLNPATAVAATPTSIVGLVRAFWIF